ncbi:hypothetical protein ACV7KR_004901, partial [Escherichia coli]
SPHPIQHNGIYLIRTAMRCGKNRLKATPNPHQNAVNHQFHQHATSMHGRLTPCVVRLADCPFKGGLAGGALRCLLLLCHLSLASAG